MEHGDLKRTIFEDGSIYEVQAVRIPNVGVKTAVVVNNAMAAKATELIHSAKRIAQARAARVSFLKASAQNLNASSGQVLLGAEQASEESNDRLAILTMVSNGISLEGSRVVSVEQWREIMVHFYQPSNVGSIEMDQE